MKIRKRKSVEKLKDFQKSFDLEDVWRLNHAKLRRYTWRQTNPRIHCRLDYFLISHHVLDITIKTDIMPSIQSDHSPILIDFKYIQKPTLGAGTWKLNTSLLKDEEYKKQFRDHLTKWIDSYYNVTNLNLKWELIKYEVRKFTIKYCKQKKRVAKDRETELENNLKSLEENERAKDEQLFIEIERIKTELKNVQLEKAQGSIIRSRVQWNEQGEKSTAYFFNLEKKNAIRKNIRKLKHNDIEETNQDRILEIIKDYYEKMYSYKATDLLNTDLFSQRDLPKLSEIEMLSMEGAITFDECTSVIKSFALNKTPGNDGLPIEFYTTFWPEINPPLMDSFTYSIENGSLTTSQRQAIISLLDKKGKDRLLVENWRPISLLNTDYKIFSKCIAERVKTVLSTLIHHSQTGFVKGRNISDGLRAILDILEETDNNKRDGLLMTIDFEKAFDSISWEYMFKVLRLYNFGDKIIKLIKMCYTDISSCVMNFKRTSRFFNVQRGVRQGDPLSPYLFILSVELMSHHIRHNESIRGLNYDDHEVKLLMYADDATVILQDETDAKRLLSFLKHYEKVSGLKINQSKTEGMWLGRKKYCKRKPLQLKWQSSLKILGIYIGYNQEELEQKNFKDKIKKMKLRLNLWKQRNLTIYGKTLILKSYALSQLLYVSSVFHLPEYIMKEAEDLAYEFLWNCKQHKVKKKVAIQDFELGGCRMIDLIEMNKLQKIKWIKKFNSPSEHSWKHTMKVVLGIKDLHLFLKSNFKLPSKNQIPLFYMDVLECWKELKYENVLTVEDIVQQYIWYNESIIRNNNVLISRYFIEKGILQIGNIIKEDGTFMNFQELSDEFGVDRSYFLFYMSHLRCIPMNGKI